MRWCYNPIKKAVDMNILVFSDSHSDIKSMVHAVENNHPDMIIHLGDNYNDAQILKAKFPEIPLQNVVGNCDLENARTVKTFDIDSIKFLITHGHLYGVKSRMDKLIKKGRQEQADIVLFGHTHKAYIRKEDGMWVINPGIINKISKSSYAQIIIQNGQADCKIIDN